MSDIIFTIFCCLYLVLSIYLEFRGHGDDSYSRASHEASIHNTDFATGAKIAELKKQNELLQKLVDDKENDK